MGHVYELNASFICRKVEKASPIDEKIGTIAAAAA
jgi:hypothetical protein